MSNVEHVWFGLGAKTDWFWLSFADPLLPAGEQFLGVAIVSVDTKAYEAAQVYYEEHPRNANPSGKIDPALAAVFVSHLQGINPGGEVASFAATPKLLEKVPASMRNRLLTRQELVDAGLIGVV